MGAEESSADDEVGPEVARSKPDLADLLRALGDGDPDVLETLIPLVYRELKDLARAHLRREAAGHTLQTTALVNEAYVRLARERRITARNRVEFFGVASHAMRRVLVDYARKRKAQKRGGGADHVPLDAVEPFLGEREADEVLALDRALDELGQMSPRAAKIVQYRYFVGLTVREIANLLDLSTKTIEREWNAARAWLRGRIDSRMELLREL